MRHAFTRASTVVALGRTLASWERRFHHRRELARLDERILRDVGLSRADIVSEVAKPFWQR